ncbi:hypothetical protein NN561_016349 [Cricetulus griseus]
MRSSSRGRNKCIDPGVASKEAPGEGTPWVSKHALGQKSTPGAAEQDQRKGRGREKGDHSSAKVTSEHHSRCAPGEWRHRCAFPGSRPPTSTPPPSRATTRPGTQLSGASCWTAS